MKLKQVLSNTDVVTIFGNRDQEITGITEDSRQVSEGHLFAAIKGNNTDGHKFIADVLRQKAAAILAEGKPDALDGITWVQVKDARLAVSRAADNFYRNPSHDMLVVGITGTNGKTTISYLLKNILDQDDCGCGLIGTVEYSYDSDAVEASRTTPEAAALHHLMRRMRDHGAKAVVMEVSSHALHQRRVDDVRFDLAIFTNLTQDHLDYHLTMEQYFDVKKRLFTELLPQKKSGTSPGVVINADDPYGRKIVEKTAIRCLTYGIESPADVMAEDIRLSAGESRFAVVHNGRKLDISSKLLGRHNVYNCLAAVAAGWALGIRDNVIVKAIEETESIPGRLEKIPNERGLNVYVDYAHTDDALKNVLATLKEITPGRIIIVFGCGGDRDRGKRPKMGRAAAKLADFSIITNDNSRSEDPMAIIAQIEEGFDGGRARYQVEADRKKAIELGISMAGEEDAVLVAGKGHENYQIFKDKTVYFDDRKTAKELLR